MTCEALTARKTLRRVTYAIEQASTGPFPVANLGLVDSVGVGVVEVLANLILQPVLYVSAGGLEPRHAVDRVDGEVEAVGLVFDRQLERRVDAAEFLVAAHVQVDVIGPAVGELVNQPRVSVKIEDDRLVDGEQAVEIAVGEAVRMFGARLKLEQVHDVDETQLKIRELLAQYRDRGERFDGRDVARARDYHVGLAALVGAGP